MKTKSLIMFLTLVLVLLVLPISPAYPQVTMYGNVGFGAQLQKGQTTVPATYGGVDISLFSDSSSGLRWVSRTMYYYADYGDERDIQAINEWFWQTKAIRFFGADWYSGLGVGMLWEFEEAGDKKSIGFGVDFGVDLYRNFSIGFTTLWQPIDGEPDPVALMFKVDLSP